MDVVIGFEILKSKIKRKVDDFVYTNRQFYTFKVTDKSVGFWQKLPIYR